MQQVEALPDSMLRYTKNFLGVGNTPTDIITVPVTHLGREEHIQRRPTGSVDGGQEKSELFKPVEFVQHRNIDIHDDISVIAYPRMN